MKNSTSRPGQTFDPPAERQVSGTHGEKRLGIPHQKIRRIVDGLSIHAADDEVRSEIRRQCDPKDWPDELRVRAEEYAVSYFKRCVGRS